MAARLNTLLSQQHLIAGLKHSSAQVRERMWPQVYQGLENGYDIREGRPA